ncbi:MAG: hypothetical protein WC494_02385 [Candidatus Pacearchaeota archaeon]
MGIKTNFLTFLFVVLLIGIVSSDTTLSEPSSCCEKTLNGAYCINTNQTNCDPNFKSSMTSCETTSYCKLGTCYDSSEGICMENTPQSVCINNGGTWDSRELEEVPQCQLGCCIIADQAAFVSLVRCKRLSSFFGVENNYRTDITSEIQCIATAQSQDMGACVYEKEYERVCEFTTRADCGAEEKVETANTTSSEKTFYKDLLCSAEELNTICARQTSTTCYNGKVYWFDSCGNRENVYSSDKDKSWNNGRVLEPDEVCSPNGGSDKNCGNCDYLLGSRCAEWEGNIGKPSESDYYCKKTECVDRNGDKRLNGESWCVYDGNVGGGLDSVGSRYYREICVDGEVVVEPCAEYRNEVCLEGGIETSEGVFGTAACRVNRWQDCTQQTDYEDCTNIDKRDCMWLEKVEGTGVLGSESSGDRTTAYSNPTAGETTSFTNPTASVIAPLTGLATSTETDDSYTGENGVCVPQFPPGFNFWSDTTTQQVCGQGSVTCTVITEKDIFGNEKVIEGKECLEEQWALEANRICTALGDCGGYVNYVGEYTDDGYEWKEDKKTKEFSPNTINKIVGGFTGMIVKMVTGGWDEVN